MVAKKSLRQLVASLTLLMLGRALRRLLPRAVCAPVFQHAHRTFSNDIPVHIPDGPTFELQV
jgi:hypothetical protein